MANWLVPDPTVERLDLDDGSWVDVVRGSCPGVTRSTTACSPPPTGSRARCSATSGGSTRRGRWRPTGPVPNRRSTRSTPGCAARYGVPFTAPALALYRNERDSVAFHRDLASCGWLDDTVIAVLTFGARRPWLLRPLGGRRNYVDDDLTGASRLRSRQRRSVGDGRGHPGPLAARRPQGARRCRTRISVQWRYTSRRAQARHQSPVLRARHFSKSGDAVTSGHTNLSA